MDNDLQHVGKSGKLRTFGDSPEDVFAENNTVVSEGPFGTRKKGDRKIIIFILAVAGAVWWCLERYWDAMATEAGRHAFNEGWLHVLVTALPIYLMLLLIRQVRKYLVEDRGEALSKYAGVQSFLLVPIFVWCLAGMYFTSVYVHDVLSSTPAKFGLYAVLWIAGLGIAAVLYMRHRIAGIRRD